MTDMKNHHLNHINCLIVDDDRFIRNIAKTALQQMGIQNIKEASSAAEAESIIKSTKIDLILTDQQMPEKTGLEMIETLLQTDPEFTKRIPVIMVTADTRESTVLKAKALNLREYIIKPLSTGTLKKRILSIFNLEEN